MSLASFATETSLLDNECTTADATHLRLADASDLALAQTFCPHCFASHVGFHNCFDYQVTACLLDAHTRLSTDAHHLATTLECSKSPNPTVESLLGSEHADAVALVIHYSQRTTRMPEVADRMAAFIIMYRLLKWRLHPTETLREHVPVFYQPTKVQLEVPHPVTMDFLAFPKLRDALLEDPSIYLEASPEIISEFDKDFAENLTVQWSPLEPLFVRTPLEEWTKGAPRFIINPTFERHCLVFENWAMRGPWLDKYPHLACFVNRCRPSFSFVSSRFC